jgi:hypothetical protein
MVELKNSIFCGAARRGAVDTKQVYERSNYVRVLDSTADVKRLRSPDPPFLSDDPRAVS